MPLEAHDLIAGRCVDRELTEAEIDAYIATGEPDDKAGAYAIQGIGAKLVEKTEGDLNNVIGFPLWLFQEMIEGK